MGLQEYVIRRIIITFILLWAIATVNFMIFNMLPGTTINKYVAKLSAGGATPERIEQLKHIFGLDRPLHEQYILYILNLLQGNWGLSFVYQGTPVSKIIFGPKLFNTIILMGTSMFLGALISTFIGMYAGWRRGRFMDKLTIIASYMGASAPVFWVGLLILMFLSAYLQLIPVSGTVSTEALHADLFTRAADYLWHMIGPLLTLVIYFIPTYLLYIRNHVVSLLGEDFLTVLVAKGLPEKTILFKHIIRYVLVTVVTLLAVQSPLLISGAIITETVFGWNGIGLLLYSSVLSSDYPVIQGVFILTIIVVVIFNMLADAIYAVLDPRIKAGVW